MKFKPTGVVTPNFPTPLINPPPSDTDVPDSFDPPDEVPIFDPPQQQASDGDDEHFPSDQCEHSQCNLQRGHSGPHSYERVVSR